MVDNHTEDAMKHLVEMIELEAYKYAMLDQASASVIHEVFVMLGSIAERVATHRMREDKNYEAGLNDLSMFAGGKLAEAKSIIRKFILEFGGLGDANPAIRDNYPDKTKTRQEEAGE